MPDFAFLVPPDAGLSVRSRTKPKLLSQLFDGVSDRKVPPSVLLNLLAEERNLTERRETSGRYKGVPWRCTISADGATPLISFRSPVAQEYLALHIALLPTIRRLLLDRSVAFVGAAAFASEGRATVLAGATGSGKTSLLLGALERGAAFLGDEYLGIGDTGGASAIVRAFALREETLALAPSIAARLSPSRRRSLLAASLARRLTRGLLEPLVHVPPAEVGVPVANSPLLPMKRLVWIEPARGEVPRIEPISVPDIIDRLAIMQTMHDKAYGDLGVLFDGARGHVGEYPSRWRAVLERGLGQVACLRLVIAAGVAPSKEALELVLTGGP
jgi:hypothetical protein